LIEKYVAPLQTKKFYHWFLNCAVLVNQYVPNSQRIWSSFAKKILYYNQRLSRACIVHLVINRNNRSYVKTMSCSGSHLGIPINIKNTTFVILRASGYNIVSSLRMNFIFFGYLEHIDWLRTHN
jgi:hypothetical protein